MTNTWTGERRVEIKRVLVANRGEIAVRVFETARRMGLVCVAVFSDPDRDSAHVRAADMAIHLPGVSSAQTYLDINKIIEAARRSGADAIHPGYGFLAENPEFAAAVQDAGLVWVGPTPQSIASMALKVAAKRIGAEAGVPLVPGSEIDADATDARIAELAQGVRYPLMVKASAGGGGKGMRIVTRADELAESLAGARREAAASFGDSTVFLERYLPQARHVEVQIFGDEHGNVLHLFERECSVQRRHQKIIEEAPSPGVTSEIRALMFKAATALAAQIRYQGAGTVEFLVSGEGEDQEFFFLEMNTRLQVEHRVTELITGFDLVEWQLLAAQGDRLGITQSDVSCSGHGIEARLYAEDPANGFLPGAGLIEAWDSPGDLAAMVDSSYEAGDEVSPHYDPLLAKIVVAGETRLAATNTMVTALEATHVAGVKTNRDLLLAVVGSTAFGDGDTTTAFLDEHPEFLSPDTAASYEGDPLLAVAAAFAHWADRWGSEQTIRRGQLDRTGSSAQAGRSGPLGQMDQISGSARSGQFGPVVPAGSKATLSNDPVPARWRNVSGTPGFVGLQGGGEQLWVLLERQDRGHWNVDIARHPDPYSGEREPIGTIAVTGPIRTEGVGGVAASALFIERDGVIVRFAVVANARGEINVRSPLGDASFRVGGQDEADAGAKTSEGPVSPVPGTVVAVPVEPGQAVTIGQTLVVLEAMKMEHRILAESDGHVDEVLVVPGQSVDSHQLLARLSTAQVSNAAASDDASSGAELPTPDTSNAAEPATGVPDQDGVGAGSSGADVSNPGTSSSGVTE
jgi:acetyl/propionyl-CoA carboxylase alpha subunit